MDAPWPAFAPAPQRSGPRPSPLARFNAALAAPVARFARALGFAPGQLSLQAFTLTILGLLRMADGQWLHMAAGAGIVYAGLLLDRADAILAAQAPPSAWTSLLGLAFDRLVEVALLVGLGVLTVRGVHGSPLPPLAGLSDGWVLVLGTATAGLMMGAKAIAAYADLHILRTHLLSTRRLPGAMAIPRARPAFAVVEPLAGRDETILAWCLGVVLGQLDLTLIALGTVQVLLLVERLVLFRLRLQDPEVDAIRVLSDAA